MRLSCIFASLVLVPAVAGFAWYYWPLKIQATPLALNQHILAGEAGTRVFVRNRALVGEIAHFDDGLFAFLMFDYLRGQPQLAGRPVLLTVEERGSQPLYLIRVRLPDDLLAGIALLADLKASRLTSDVRFTWLLPRQLKYAFQQTAVFLNAYSGPAGRRLRDYDAAEIQAYLRRFIRFKSLVDPRIARDLDPIPSPLTRKEASRIAADIISVARFYDVPIDLFLGVGAMENNYMNVAGDLKNTAWKSRPEPGDIVVRRRRGKVLVRNDSMGVWQVTRQSLRYAHRLFLKDKRDYSLLPERLRPAGTLHFESVTPDVLTTYAALLLRDLLDKFGANATLAAGAYNGTVTNPNLHYAEGVEMVADYAARIIGRAAELDRVALDQTSVDSEKLAKSPQNLAAAKDKESSLRPGRMAYWRRGGDSNPR